MRTNKTIWNSEKRWRVTEKRKKVNNRVNEKEWEKR